MAKPEDDNRLAEEVTERVLQFVRKFADGHDHIEAVNTDDGIEITYGYQGPPGDVFVSLYPSALAEWAITESRTIIENNIRGAISNLESKDRLRPFIETEGAINLEESILPILAKILAEWFVEGMHGKMRTSLIELCDESLFLTEALLQSWVAQYLSTDGQPLVSGKPQGKLKDFVKDLVAERQQFLRGSLSSFSKSAQTLNLSEHYGRLLPIWQDAKTICDQNSHRPTWKKMVNEAFPDEKLPGDLIARLSGKLNDIPEEMQAKLSGKGGGPKPSDIALEHAARFCGKPPYSLTIRRLYQIVEKNNDGGEIESNEVLH